MTGEHFNFSQGKRLYTHGHATMADLYNEIGQMYHEDDTELTVSTRRFLVSLHTGSVLRLNMPYKWTWMADLLATSTYTLADIKREVEQERFLYYRFGIPEELKCLGSLARALLQAFIGYPKLPLPVATIWYHLAVPDTDQPEEYIDTAYSKGECLSLLCEKGVMTLE